MIICLDLDGVVSNFIQRAINVLDLTIEHDKIQYWDHISDIAKEQKGISKNKMFSMCATKDFWKGVEKYPHADELLDLLEPYKPIIITHPIRNSASLKQIWIKDNMSQYYKEDRYLLGSAKYVAAHSNSLLIDDKEDNINKFSAHGGNTYLFPQSWNTNRNKVGNFKLIKQEIITLINRVEEYNARRK